MRCVRGIVEPDEKVKGSVSTSCKGVSLIPMTICAGERSSWGSAPAFKRTVSVCVWKPRHRTHLQQFLSRPNTTLARLHEHPDIFLLDELAYRLWCQRTATLPNTLRVFPSYTYREFVRRVEARVKPTESVCSTRKDPHGCSRLSCVETKQDAPAHRRSTYLPREPTGSRCPWR